MITYVILYILYASSTIIYCGAEGMSFVTFV
jgi:hypothetical protein